MPNPKSPQETIQAASQQLSGSVQRFVDSREDLFGASAAPQASSQPTEDTPGEAESADDIAAGPKGIPQGEGRGVSQSPSNPLEGRIHDLLASNRQLMEQNQKLMERVLNGTAPKTEDAVDEDLKALVEESAIDGDRLTRVIDRRAAEKSKAAAQEMVQQLFGPVLAVAEADAQLSADPEIGEDYLANVMRLNTFIEQDPDTKALYESGIAGGKYTQARKFAYLRMKAAQGQAKTSKAKASAAAREVVVQEQKPHAGLPSTPKSARTEAQEGPSREQLRESLAGAAARRDGADPGFMATWFRPFSPSNESLQRLWEQGNL